MEQPFALSRRRRPVPGFRTSGCRGVPFLALLLLLFSCRTHPDPRTTPPGVSLKVFGSRYNTVPAEFEVIVGAGYPSPGLVSHVIPNSLRIEALATQPERGLRAMRLIVDTPYREDGCYRYGREGKLETTAPKDTPVPLRTYEEPPYGLKPVGIMALTDYNLYESYVRKFGCPPGYDQGVTVTLVVEAENVAGLSSKTPPLQLRFWR